MTFKLLVDWAMNAILTLKVCPLYTLYVAPIN